MEPRINKIKEVLNVTKTAEKKEVLDPIIKNLPNEQKIQMREYPLNATKYVNQPIIEPVIEKEKLNIKFVDSKDQIQENEPVIRDPVVQIKARVVEAQQPADQYYYQTIKQPVVTKEHMIINFDEPKPVFKENKPITKKQEESNSYTVNHDLKIPVEDQRLVATPAKVAYKIPVYGYEYVDV